MTEGKATIEDVWEAGPTRVWPVIPTGRFPCKFITLNSSSHLAYTLNVNKSEFTERLWNVIRHEPSIEKTRVTGWTVITIYGYTQGGNPL